MPADPTFAIVLRVVDFSESSCVVTLFTCDFGKLTGLAKGGRRPKGPFESALDLLSVVRLMVIRKSAETLDLLTEAKLERRFRAASRDLARLYAGYYVAELLVDLTHDHDPHPELFEAVKASFDPAPELDQLARIERDLPLEVKLRKTAAILIKRSERVHALVSVLRSLPPPEHSAFHDAHKNAIGANSLLLWGVTRVFQDHSSQLAVEPARAAAAFRGLLFAVSFPLNDPAELMTADEAIEVLLSGVMKDRP